MAVVGSYVVISGSGVVISGSTVGYGVGWTEIVGSTDGGCL